MRRAEILTDPQAFNEPNTHLVHTDGKGVERITETGVVATSRAVLPAAAG